MRRVDHECRYAVGPFRNTSERTSEGGGLNNITYARNPLPHARPEPPPTHAIEKHKKPRLLTIPPAFAPPISRSPAFDRAPQHSTLALTISRISRRHSQAWSRHFTSSALSPCPVGVAVASLEDPPDGAGVPCIDNQLMGWGAVRVFHERE